MKCTICPKVLPSLDHENEFVTAMLHADSAMESFKFRGIGKKTGDLSITQIEAVITNLDASIYAWQHDLSKSMSNAVKKIFDGNDDRVKLLNGDMKKLYKQEADCKKQMKSKGLTSEVEENLNHQYDEIIDSIEHTKMLLAQYRTALYITAEVSDAVDRAMGKAVEYGNIIIRSFRQYMDMVKKREDAAHKKISFNHDKFESDLTVLIDAMNKFGKVDDQLQQIQKEFDTICTTQIYGKDVSSDPQDGVKFEFSKTVAMNEQYDTYNKVANKVHERLKGLTADLAKTKKDKPGCLSYHIIAMETLFLLMISKKLSLASTMYLTPVLSLLESYQK